MPTKTNKTKSNMELFYAIIAILFVVAALFAYGYMQITSSYSSIKANYATLQINYNTQGNQLNTANSNLANISKNYDKQGNQLNTANSNLANISKKYNASKSSYTTLLSKYNITEYNLTHPYTKALFTEQVISVPAETYNYSLSSYQAGVSNFSISVPYSGYIILNYTVAPVKQGINGSTFSIYISNEKPYYSQGELIFNSYIKPYTQFNGQPTTKLIIPVVNGTAYFLLYNFENQSATIDFSINYVGFHTS
ncbi:MAG: hypothetical protein M1331_00645 [Candidatus Marsarchaeota archaeon]|nr:hypothetical protein [Candidatus Marsarchaeota archaeon]